MIKSLYIKDYLLIPEIRIDFMGGLTAVTGETGAGKSLIVDSVALALGSRAESSVVRSGCEKAEISVVFKIEDARAESWLKDNDLYDGDECIVRRLIFSNQASRAYINGSPVPAQSVKNLGSFLVEIHGQHEHQQLLRPAVQRRILDGYAGHLGKSDELAGLAASIRSEENRRHELIGNRQRLKEQLEMLRHQIAVLDQIQPEQEEFSRLKDELLRLSHAENIERTLIDISQRLFYADDTTASGILSDGTRRIEDLGEYDSSLQEFAILLAEAKVRVDDVARELRAVSDRTEFDPARIAATEERMGVLQQQSRIHNANADELPNALMELNSRATEVESQLDAIRSVDSDIQDLRDRHQALGAEISASRKKAALQLSEVITRQMQSLGMEGGEFDVELIKIDPESCANSGHESVQFAVATNPGQSKGALSRVASGGELSRLSLAIQMIGANTMKVSCIVFDEVDVGIGGKVAESVGMLLRKLGQTVQIFCITHLPQVAALGDNQLSVFKTTDSESSVGVRHLDYEHRILEISRMLGGAKITDRTKAHAKEMLSHNTT